jgi:voltage-gated potassium channel
MRSILKSKIYLLVILISSTIAVGTAGYMLVEGYTFLEALYMTIITLSTTGFGEIRPLSAGGRIFTILLLILTLSILAYSLGSLSSYLMDGDFMLLLRKRRVRKKTKHMENHIIICGYGRNGRKAAEMLAVHNLPFVVIEQNHTRAAALREKNIPVYEESALEDEVLKAAGIEHAKALLCALPDDTDNLYVVLSAREMNKGLTIISRASNDSVEKKLKIAGASDVVKPDTIGGTHMAQLVINPDVKEFIDFVSYDAENAFKEVDVNKYEKLWGKSLLQIRKHADLDISVVGLKNEDGKYIVNPPSDLVLTKELQLIIMATTEQLKKFKQHFS